jgi:hypothetical protein
MIVPSKKNRVVQKLKFLNNNRLKTARNVNFVRNSHFLGDLQANRRLADNQPGY